MSLKGRTELTFEWIFDPVWRHVILNSFHLSLEQTLFCDSIINIQSITPTQYDF